MSPTAMLTLGHATAVIITDHEYPVRPAFSLLTKVLDDFTAKVPQTSFANPAGISFPEISTYIEKYQDPRQADAIMRVQQELDETKIVLVSTGLPLRAGPVDRVYFGCGTLPYACVFVVPGALHAFSL
jgi:hypothetical protein